MKTNSSAIIQIPQSNQIGELVPNQPIELHKPNSWINTGYSPTEIILATAILIRSIAGLLAIKQR
jgi:hypothetical protein